MVSGIIHVIRNGPRWRDASAEYGPHEALYNRLVRWCHLVVFSRVFARLVRQLGEPECLMCRWRS
ncbi:transposase [Roseomonas sp. KE2513]|uniref:transposase n=1 Tax=Roseomonas sp. KE2513 TaxID=2479202 RepID=UPI0035CA2C76